MVCAGFRWWVHAACSKRCDMVCAGFRQYVQHAAVSPDGPAPAAVQCVVSPTVSPTMVTWASG